MRQQVNHRLFVGSALLATLTVSACGTAPAGSTLRDEAGTAEGTSYQWREHIEFFETDAPGWSGRDPGSAYYNDVMAHTTNRWQNSDPTTNAHETMHGLLNGMNNRTRVEDQFVYFEAGRGVYITEPEMNARLIRDYVPAGARALAASRYQLYLVDQVAAYFPNVLYQFDEWNSYVAGARVGVEMFQAGRWTDGGQDVVDGAMDFLYFASAAAYALSVHEPTYVATNVQFKAAYAMLAEQSAIYIEAGLQAPPFSRFHAGRLREHLRTSPESAGLRAFLKNWMGSDWTEPVLGF